MLMQYGGTMFDYETMKYICPKCKKEMELVFAKNDGQGSHHIYGCPDHPEEMDQDEDTTWHHPWKKD